MTGTTTKRSFSRKASAPQQGGDIDYTASNEWKKYQFECMKGKVTNNGTKQRKERQIAGIVSLIFDCGKPQAGDSEWETKCALPSGDEEFSAEELAYKAEKKGSNFIWVEEWDKVEKCHVQVRKQTSPSFPSQEYGICIDFPSIMVDYSKHYNSTSDVEDLRPFRISLNGQDFKDKGQIGTVLRFDDSFKPIPENNIIYKICKAAGREEELLKDTNFDIGVAAGAVCNFKVTFDLNVTEKGVWFNPKVSTPTAIEDMLDPETEEVLHSAEKLMSNVANNPKLAEFQGILLDMPEEEYTDTMFNMLGGTKDRFNFIARAQKCVKIEKTSKAGNKYFQGIHLTDEAGEPLWSDDNKPVIGGYDDTNFAKAYNAWLDKQVGEVSNKPKEPKKENPAKKEEPTPKKETYNEPTMDFDDK